MGQWASVCIGRDRETGLYVRPVSFRGGTETLESSVPWPERSINTIQLAVVLLLVLSSRRFKLRARGPDGSLKFVSHEVFKRKLNQSPIFFPFVKMFAHSE